MTKRNILEKSIILIRSYIIHMCECAGLEKKVIFNQKILKMLRKYTTLLLVTVVFACCIIHKKKQYLIPETVPVEMRDDLQASVERGIVIYKQHCTGCHGIFSKGKDGMPDFSEQQIQKYSTRFLLQDPTSHAVAIDMHPTQLNDVLTFLRFRLLKNGKADPSDK